jgi:YD repeat-containing protein
MATLTYDTMNRLWTRTLPGGGGVQTFHYNATGTVADVTDFNGKKTTFGYDNMDRLSTRTPDVSFGEVAVSYTYWPDGQRKTMTDASGTTVCVRQSESAGKQGDTFGVGVHLRHGREPANGSVV